MATSKRTSEEDEERKKMEELFAVDEDEFEVISVAKKAIKATPAPKPVFEEEEQLAKARDILGKTTDVLREELEKKGMFKADIYSSKSSEVIAALYEFINSKSLIAIRIQLKMYRGQIILFTCEAESMSGTKTKVDKELRTICLGCTTMGIGLGSSFLGDVKASIKISEDLKLKIFFQTTGTEEWITLLDPDLLL